MSKLHSSLETENRPVSETVRLKAAWKYVWEEPLEKNSLREYIKGPFSEPQYLSAHPIVKVSVTENSNSKNQTPKELSSEVFRSGIPDAWLEYLTLKVVPETRNKFQKQESRIRTEQFRILETLRNDYHFPLAQGIPDPRRNQPKVLNSERRMHEEIITEDLKFDDIKNRLRRHFKKIRQGTGHRMYNLKDCPCCSQQIIDNSCEDTEEMIHPIKEKRDSLERVSYRKLKVTSKKDNETKKKPILVKFSTAPLKMGNDSEEVKFERQINEVVYENGADHKLNTSKYVSPDPQYGYPSLPRPTYIESRPSRIPPSEYYPTVSNSTKKPTQQRFEMLQSNYLQPDVNKSSNKYSCSLKPDVLPKKNHKVYTSKKQQTEKFQTRSTSSFCVCSGDLFNCPCINHSRSSPLPAVPAYYIPVFMPQFCPIPQPSTSFLNPFTVSSVTCNQPNVQDSKFCCCKCEQKEKSFHGKPQAKDSKECQTEFIANDVIPTTKQTKKAKDKKKKTQTLEKESEIKPNIQGDHDISKKDDPHKKKWLKLYRPYPPISKIETVGKTASTSNTSEDSCTNVLLNLIKTETEQRLTEKEHKRDGQVKTKLRGDNRSEKAVQNDESYRKSAPDAFQSTVKEKAKPARTSKIDLSDSGTMADVSDSILHSTTRIPVCNLEPLLTNLSTGSKYFLPLEASVKTDLNQGNQNFKIDIALRQTKRKCPRRSRRKSTSENILDWPKRPMVIERKNLVEKDYFSQFLKTSEIIGKSEQKKEKIECGNVETSIPKKPEEIDILKINSPKTVLHSSDFNSPKSEEIKSFTYFSSSRNSGASSSNTRPGDVDRSVTPNFENFHEILTLFTDDNDSKGLVDDLIDEVLTPRSQIRPDIDEIKK